MKKFIIAALGAALGLASLNASAAAATGTISPSLTIGGVCTINTAGVSGVFLTQTAGSTANNIPMAGGTLTVLCPGIGYSIGAVGGANSGGSTTTRQMGWGGVYIPYALGIASASGAPLVANITPVAGAGWTDFGLRAYVGANETMTSGSVAVVSANGSLTGDSFTVSGQTTAAIPSGAPVGTYTDSVTVTVAW